MDNVFIEGFELIEKLGEGGMGAVYKARQISLDRMVAIKILPRHVVQDSDSVERFLIEARIAAALKHNNIIQVYEAGQSGEDYFFVMEWVTGYTVAEWVERSGRLSETDALLVAESVADALAYAWEKAWIVHGDIKPANIMVDGDGTIKLADFLALTPPGGAERPESLREHVVGTPNYMSPEQARGVGTLDFHTDIYALGAVLYHLVTGCMPFEREPAPRETMRKQITDFIPDPQELTPELSEGCAWLIEKMMVKNARLRYGSWQELLEDVRRVKQGGMPTYPLPLPGSSTVGRCAKRESGVISIPSDQAMHHACDTIQHRDDLGAHIRSAAYILCFLIALVAVALFWLHLVGWLPDWFGLGHTEEAGAVEQGEVYFPPALAPPPLPPEPIQIIPAVAPKPFAEEVEPAPGKPPPVVKELNDPSQAQALLEYSRVFQRLIPLLKKRQYGAALAVLDAVIAGTGEGALRRRAEQDAERIRLLQEQQQSLVHNRHALKGQPVRAEPSISGTLADVGEDTISVLCSTAGGKEAIVSVPMNRVLDESVDQLIRAANPGQADRITVCRSLSRMQFNQAEAARQRLPDGPEQVDLIDWWYDWSGMVSTLRALEILDRIQMEIAQGRWQEARRLADMVEQQYADMNVFSRIKKDEWEAIRERLADVPEEPDPVAAPEIRTLPTPIPLFPDADDEEEMDTLLDVYEVNEIKEGYIRLDGQLVRLRFRFREDIRQIDAETYTTELGSENGRINVVFPKEGLRWMKRLSKQQQGRPRRSVYGTVQAAQNRLILEGRRKNKSAGADDEYVW
ncbi:MAG: serine/threonine-protein kinase [Kiritimatiellae bacterium]|nr:serine/threonine-protein kinase [Kiritimatiellia bacterium]